jgi:membrane protein insertase Oxa1/YidC/SpoIIIJ
MGAMSGQNKQARQRTYARNRTQLSRRGFEKNPESDGVFILKLVAIVLLGSFWMRMNLPGGLSSGVPVGLLIGLILIHLLEKRPDNRRTFFAVIIVVVIISYFLPSGIVL